MKAKLNFYLTKYLSRDNKTFIYTLEYLKGEHTFLHPLYVGFSPSNTLPHYIACKETLNQF